jgi:transcriptional regulator with XRE-family HTH domain
MSTTPSTGIGATLRAERLKRKLTQGDIQARTGIHHTYQSQLENGYTTPTLTTLQKYADAFGFELAILFEDPAAPKPSANLPTLNAADIAFLVEIQRHRLTPPECRRLLALVRRLTTKAVAA